MAKLDVPGFSNRTFKFLKELDANNDRDWFTANKQRYEDDVREPARAFIRAMAPPLARFSKAFVVDDRKVGGSLMRVYRDTRFAKDKTPYKTNVGIQFRHEVGKDVHAPGVYFHVSPKECFVGVGLWHPESSSLAAIRAAIVESPTRWKRARDGKKFRARFDLAGTSLSRPPRGYNREERFIEDLMRKDHIAMANLTKKQVIGKGVLAVMADHLAVSKPYMKFLAAALELEF